MRRHYAYTTLATEKRNRLREEAPEEETIEAAEPKKRRARKSAEPGPSRLARFRAFVADERTHKVFGMLLVLGSLFLLMAFVSFLFTWRVDQDLMSRGWWEILRTDIAAENWLGKLGAICAHRFIHVWFGLAAFALPFWSFLAGVRILLGTWLLPARRTLGWTAMALFWVPALFGFFFRGEFSFLGGGLGVVLTRHLTTLLGEFGAGALLVFAAVAFAVFTFNLQFGWLNALFTKKEAEPAAEAATPDPEGWTRPGVRMKTAAPVAAAAPGFEVEEPVAATNEEVTEEEEEVVEEEEENALELELDTTPMEVVEPVLSPVISTAEDLNGDLNGMSVTANAEEKVLTEDQIEAKLQEFGPYDPTLDLSSYEPPPLDLLVDHGSGEITVTKEELEANKDRIVATLG
ncbi:MAG: DNA translocase FtsK 4TM domain-containing protein, partial [Flavobacteriales bacterium]|nr:DNA translocase FtsK 4TM domain-containing protein [Flavobacteriales bacterium]